MQFKWMKYFKNKNYYVFIGCFRIFVFGLKRFRYLQMLLVWAHDGCQEWSRIFFTFQDHMSSPWFWYGSFFSTLSFPSFALKLLFIFCCFSSHLCFFFVFLIAPPPSFCYKVTSKLFFKFSICLYFQGDYAVNFRILDEDSGELGCLNLRFAMKKRNKGWLFRI